MQNEKSHKKSFSFGGRLSNRISVRAQYPGEFRSLNYKCPNLAVMLCDGEQIANLPSLSVLPNCVGSGKKAGDDSDALKNIDPMFGYEFPYPITEDYTSGANSCEYSQRSGISDFAAISVARGI